MDSRIILALDGMTLERAEALVRLLGDRVYAVKLHELVDTEGPSVISFLKKAGAARVWVDHKLHDIPNTVRLRAQALATQGADIITVHASGGIEMMQAARAGAPSTELYAVTVLTSLAEDAVQKIYSDTSEATVQRLAMLAQEAGMDGVVASPKEVALLHEMFGAAGPKLVIPGVRSLGSDVGDQERTGTPLQALQDGATHLVIGRQITEAEDPVAAFETLITELP